MIKLERKKFLEFGVYKIFKVGRDLENFKKVLSKKGFLKGKTSQVTSNTIISYLTISNTWQMVFLQLPTSIYSYSTTVKFMAFYRKLTAIISVLTDSNRLGSSG